MSRGSAGDLERGLHCAEVAGSVQAPQRTARLEVEARDRRQERQKIVSAPFTPPHYQHCCAKARHAKDLALEQLTPARGLSVHLVTHYPL